MIFPVDSAIQLLNNWGQCDAKRHKNARITRALSSTEYKAQEKSQAFPSQSSSYLLSKAVRAFSNKATLEGGSNLEYHRLGKKLRSGASSSKSILQQQATRTCTK